jgi:hypothetical protein
MLLSDYLNLVLPAAILFISGQLAVLLNSDLVKNFLKAQETKLAAEAQTELSHLAHSNNALVHTLVSEAMAYAENKEPEILTLFKSKADYVVSVVKADPRFGSLGVPADALARIVEDLFENFYKDVTKPTA